MEVLNPGIKQNSFSSAALAEFYRSHAEHFDRRDHCVVTLTQQQVVGYNFYAQAQTDVEPGVVFEFPDRFFYSYKAFTHSAHRGLGLAPARWTCFRQWRERHQQAGPTISYIALDNLASLHSGNADDGVTIGYSAYRPSARKVWCFRSPNAKRLGVGFSSTATTTD